MTLIWKLLRRHISIGQLVGFFFANLLGMLIVLLSMLSVFIFALFVIIFIERVPGEIQREREEENNKAKKTPMADKLQDKRETENTDKGKQKLDERRDSL